MNLAETSTNVANAILGALLALGFPDARERSARGAQAFCEEVAVQTGDCNAMRTANAWGIRAGRAEQDDSR